MPGSIRLLAEGRTVSASDGGHTAVKKILAHREEPVPSLTEVRREAGQSKGWLPGLDLEILRRLAAKDDGQTVGEF